ncbi:hypothetical protein D1872_319460 [compost metagenome]
MIAERDRGVDSDGTFGLSDTPVLRERLIAVNRRSIVSHRGIDVVRAAIAVYGAFIRTCRTVCSPVIYHVVLDQRISGPAIKSQVSVTRR